MIQKIDHMVITTKNPAAIISFYETIGFLSREQNNRIELFVGDFKINVHTLGQELLPCAKNVQIGCNDFCFEVEERIEQVYDSLLENGVPLESEIVTRHGVRGQMKSIYLRDPDGNLIELSSYELK
ncbi:MAG: VOC family protein [Bacillota bacterium]